MAVNEIQVHRIILNRHTGNPQDQLVIEPNMLSDGDYLTWNVAPAATERASASGTTTTPNDARYDGLTATLVLKNDNRSILATAIGQWQKATYTGATAQNGQRANAILGNPCPTPGYTHVIAQGICDDGSTTDIQFPFCMPRIGGDEALGSEVADVEINLYPQPYDEATMGDLTSGDDPFPAYDYIMGDNSLTAKQRYNVTTGEYETVTTPSA